MIKFMIAGTLLVFMSLALIEVTGEIDNLINLQQNIEAAMGE